MIGIGSLMAAWVGRTVCGAFVCAGILHLVPPPPPPATEELHAMFVCLAAMIPLATGEIVAVYLGLVSTASNIKNRAGRARELKILQRAIFQVITDAASTISQIFTKLLK